MKVLSLLQPWATLVVCGAKAWECRSWQTSHRGPLLIHASAKKPGKREKLFFEEAEYFKIYIDSMDYLPFGSIIGRVDLVGIYTTDFLLQNLEAHSFHNWQQEFTFDDYSSKRYAWKLEEPKPLPFVLPVKGTLGLWDYNGMVD